MVQGNGGNHEGLYDHWLNPLPDWAQNGLYDGKNYGKHRSPHTLHLLTIVMTRFDTKFTRFMYPHLINVGFGLMTIYNETTLHYENLDENLGTVYDLWVTRKR